MEREFLSLSAIEQRDLSVDVKTQGSTFQLLSPLGIRADEKPGDQPEAYYCCENNEEDHNMLLSISQAWKGKNANNMFTVPLNGLGLQKMTKSDKRGGG